MVPSTAVTRRVSSMRLGASPVNSGKVSSTSDRTSRGYSNTVTLNRRVRFPSCRIRYTISSVTFGSVMANSGSFRLRTMGKLRSLSSVSPKINSTLFGSGPVNRARIGRERPRSNWTSPGSTVRSPSTQPSLGTAATVGIGRSGIGNSQSAERNPRSRIA